MSSRNPEYFVGKPVESLQHMLRVLAQGDNRLHPVVADGVFGSATRSAVMAFQRSRRRPATGVVDQQTWEQIVAAYEEELILQADAEPLIPIWNPRQVIAPGESNYHVLLAQAMLKTLHQEYATIPPVAVSGTMDGPTVASLRRFQMMAGLEPTGILNKTTWKHLARHYTLAAGDGKPSK